MSDINISAVMMDEGDSPEEKAEEGSLAYKVIRKAQTYETMFHVYHTLGIQSNIAVGARYSHLRNGCSLIPPVLFKALRSVISEHPALGSVGVRQASEKKKGNHQLYESRLTNIDLTDCVIFQEDDEKNLTRWLEDAHNNYEWFTTGDTSKPWWRLLVYNSSYVIFVYHHALGDGLSGYAFHRSLLETLNQLQKSREFQTTSEDLESTIVSTSTKESIPHTLDELHDKVSMVNMISSFLFWILVRFFYSTKHLYFSDAIVPMTYPTIQKPFPEESRTMTKVQILRIPGSTMRKCAPAWRANQTTFSSLLHTLVNITLASDIYPKAKVGFSSQVINIRSFRKVDPGLNVFVNASTSYDSPALLGKYRSTSYNYPNEKAKNLSPLDKPAEDQIVNPEIVWKLAAAYKRNLNKYMESRKILQGLIAGGTFLGLDEEEVGRDFYGINLFSERTALLSNLGVLDGLADGEWKIDDVVFSAGATKGWYLAASEVSQTSRPFHLIPVLHSNQRLTLWNPAASVGCVGIVFNVASIKDGDCIICAVYEKGVLRDDMVKRTLDGIERRLNALL